MTYFSRSSASGPTKPPFRRVNARKAATDYRAEEGSDLTGLAYEHLDVGDFKAIEAYQPAFKQLDVLVLAQGTVLYKRGEFEMPGF